MSTTINSTQYAQLLSQFTNQFRYSGSEMPFDLNSIFQLYGAVDNIANGNDAQKENGIKTIVEKVFNFAMNFINKAGKAKQETKESSTAVSTTLDKYKTERSATNAEIDKILDEIENGDMRDIADALDKIEKLGGEGDDIKKQIEAKKETIQECIDAIKEAQANNDLKTILTNLMKIEGLRSEIKGLIDSTVVISAEIETQNTIVSQATIGITEKETKVETLLVDEIKKATESAEKETTEGAKNVKFTSEGAIEITTGEALQATAATEAGASVITFGISAAFSATTEKTALDYITAGETHCAGGGENLIKVGEALGEIGGGMADVSRYATTIGSVITQAGNLVGTYLTEQKGLIESIGTITKIENDIKDGGTLATNVNEDLQTINDIVSKHDYSDTENKNYDLKNKLKTPTFTFGQEN